MSSYIILLNVYIGKEQKDTFIIVFQRTPQGKVFKGLVPKIYGVRSWVRGEE